MTVLFVGNQECLDVWFRMAAQFYILGQNTFDYFGILSYSGSQKSEVCPMPTEAYALCPRRPMPSRTSSF